MTKKNILIIAFFAIYTFAQAQTTDSLVHKVICESTSPLKQNEAINLFIEYYYTIQNKNNPVEIRMKYYNKAIEILLSDDVIHKENENIIMAPIVNIIQPGIPRGSKKMELRSFLQKVAKGVYRDMKIKTIAVGKVDEKSIISIGNNSYEYIVNYDQHYIGKNSKGDDMFVDVSRRQITITKTINKSVTDLTTSIKYPFFEITVEENLKR